MEVTSEKHGHDAPLDSNDASLENPEAEIVPDSTGASGSSSASLTEPMTPSNFSTTQNNSADGSDAAVNGVDENDLKSTPNKPQIPSKATKTSKANGAKGSPSAGAAKGAKGAKGVKSAKNAKNVGAIQVPAKISNQKDAQIALTALNDKHRSKMSLADQKNAVAGLRKYALVTCRNVSEKHKIAQAVFSLLGDETVRDEKLHYELLKFMQEFVVRSEHDRIAAAISEIMQPFVRLFKFAVVEKRDATLRLLIYSFAQIYELMLARLTLLWKGKMYYMQKRWIRSLPHSNLNLNLNDDDENDMETDDGEINEASRWYLARIGDAQDEENKFDKDWKKINQVMEVLCQRMLELLTSPMETVRSNCIKLAETLILTLTNDEDVYVEVADKQGRGRKGNKFSQKNIKPHHPLLSRNKLNEQAKTLFKQFIECFQAERTDRNDEDGTESTNKKKKQMKGKGQEESKENGYWTVTNYVDGIKAICSIAEKRLVFRPLCLNALQEFGNNHLNFLTGREYVSKIQPILKDQMKRWLNVKDFGGYSRQIEQILRLLSLSTEEERSILKFIDDPDVSSRQKTPRKDEIESKTTPVLTDTSEERSSRGSALSSGRSSKSFEDSPDSAANSPQKRFERVWARLRPVGGGRIERYGLITVHLTQSEHLFGYDNCCDIRPTEPAGRKLIGSTQCKYYFDMEHKVPCVQMDSKGLAMDVFDIEDNVWMDLKPGEIRTLQDGSQIRHKGPNNSKKPILFKFDYYGGCGVKTKFDKIYDEGVEDRDILGKGAFGCVRLAFLRSDRSRKFAVKTVFETSKGMKVLKQRIQKRNPNASDEFDMGSIEMLNKCPHFVKFFSFYYMNDVCKFVMEFCAGGTLENLMDDVLESEKKRKGKTAPFPGIEENLYLSYAKQICIAAEYLHSRNLVHRDFKPSNLLFLTKGKQLLKLTDYSVARKVDNKGLCSTMVGSPYFAAPEVIASDNKNKYDGCCADMWSVGVIMYYMFQGPWSNVTPGEFDRDAKRQTLVFSRPVDPLRKQFIESCINKDPNSRLTASQLLHHEYLSQISLSFSDSSNSSASNDSNSSNKPKIGMHGMHGIGGMRGMMDPTASKGLSGVKRVNGAHGKGAMNRNGMKQQMSRRSVMKSDRDGDHSHAGDEVMGKEGKERNVKEKLLTRETKRSSKLLTKYSLDPKKLDMINDDSDDEEHSADENEEEEEEEDYDVDDKFYEDKQDFGQHREYDQTSETSKDSSSSRNSNSKSKSQSKALEH